MNPHLKRFLERRAAAEGVPGPDAARDRALVARIDQAIVNGQANRSPVDVERCLAICRGCEQFTGDNCRRMFRSCSTRDTWIRALLILRGRPTHDCEQWSKKDDPCDPGLRCVRRG